MSNGSGLPYAPHLYEMKCYHVVTNSALYEIVKQNTKRIYVHIVRLSGPLAITPYWSFNQSGGEDGRFIANTENELELHWYKHGILCQSSIYSNGYGSGTTFSVIEVLYNLPDAKGKQDDLKKPRSLSDKIKDFVLSGRGYSGIGSG